MKQKRIPAPIQRLLEIMHTETPESAGLSDYGQDDAQAAAQVAEAYASLLPPDAKKDAKLSAAGRRATSVALALEDLSRKSFDSDVQPTPASVYGHKLVTKHGADVAVRTVLGELVQACQLLNVDLAEGLANVRAQMGKKGFVQKSVGKAPSEAKVVRHLLAAASSHGIEIRESDVVSALALKNAA